MRRIWAIARKEFIHIIRDPRLLMVILAMPLLQLFLYSYALSFDVKNLPTATLDFDHTTQSRQYLDALQQSNYFTVTQQLGSYSEVDKAFESNTDKVVVVVGNGLRQRPRGRPPGQRPDPRRRLRRELGAARAGVLGGVVARLRRQGRRVAGRGEGLLDELAAAL